LNTVAIDSVSISVGITYSTVTIDVGIYSLAGSRLGSTGATTTNGVGRNDMPLTARLTLTSGVYAECVTTDSLAATFHGTTNAIKQPMGWTSCVAATGNVPLPVSLTFPCPNNTRLTTINMWGHVVGGAP
jgi:hypothetical protein